MTKLGQELIAGLAEAIEYERGEKILRTSDNEVPESAKDRKGNRLCSWALSFLKSIQPLFTSTAGSSSQGCFSYIAENSIDFI